MIKSHFIRYFSSTMIIKIMGIITMPIIIRKLSIEDFANYSLLNTYFSILIMLMMLNFQSAISRFYFEYKNIKFIILGALLISIACYVIISIFLFSNFGHYLECLLSLSKESIFILISAVYFQINYNTMEEYLKINEESKIVSTIVSISGVLTYFTLLILVYRIDNTSVSLVLSKAIILLPINIFCLYILFKNTSFSDISFNGISVMFKYSIFLMPYALSGFLLQQFDRVMLSQLGNLADVAYYSFAYSIGSLPYIIVSVILVSWNPSFMRLCNENKFNNLNRQSKLLLIISSCIISFFMMFYKEISYLIGGDKYMEIADLSLILFFSNVFTVGSTVYLWFVNFKLKAYCSSFFTLLSLFANVMLNYFLIPKYGAYAAATSTFISYFLLYVFLSIYVHVNNHNEFGLKVIDIGLIILFCFFVMLFSLYAILPVRLFLSFIMIIVLFKSKRYFSELI
ncbi:hypothetical protein EFU41_17960 [Vibrio cholerae]|uniref:lipopolysaccharide biosynthesis protein n=1 Tax=Vibrio cholerae TaxID=666 RepID=UPI0011DB5332|nr:oligosaccharide flippase family protein [Vibrio cholerae]EGQ8592733.1 oligosaccharide flippase family protein [Vibrio cholerae]EGQ8662244.1 oligosaccharide flippase family protein [Vibrio cholerae]EGR1126188.1 hypothetical protein [Vibrio cholerae]TXZ21377.1 oligosaccharide flippase family protein [Vibrio cholerae]GIA49598.1 putative capsular polysaccharide repeating unit transporter CpsL [Vibrio cholerae]